MYFFKEGKRDQKRARGSFTTASMVCMAIMRDRQQKKQLYPLFSDLLLPT